MAARLPGEGLPRAGAVRLALAQRALLRQAGARAGDRRQRHPGSEDRRQRRPGSRRARRPALPGRRRPDRPRERGEQVNGEQGMRIVRYLAPGATGPAVGIVDADTGGTGERIAEVPASGRPRPPAPARSRRPRARRLGRARPSSPGRRAPARAHRPPRQDPGPRRQLPPGRRAARRRPRRRHPPRLHQALDGAARPRGGDPLPRRRGADGRGDRAGGGDRRAGQGHPGRAGGSAHLRLHDRQRRLGARAAPAPRAGGDGPLRVVRLAQRQVAGRLLPGRAVDRRSRCAAGHDRPRDHDRRERRGAHPLQHRAPDLRRAPHDRLHLPLLHARAGRPDRHRGGARSPPARTR